MSSIPSTYDGVAAGLSLLVLLTEFAMLRAPLLRSQVRLYAFQSLVVTGLALYVAASKHIGELYVLAGLSFLLKVVVVPSLILRLLRDADTDLAGSSVLGTASAILIALVVAAFGFFAVGSLHVSSASLPTSSSGNRVRDRSRGVCSNHSEVGRGVPSNWLLFTRERCLGCEFGRRFGLPLIVDIAFLFDLLVAVVVFGVIMRVHHARNATLSTSDFDRLKG